MRNNEKLKRLVTGFTLMLTTNDVGMFEAVYTNVDTGDSSMIYATTLSDLIKQLSKDRKSLMPKKEPSWA